MDKTAEQSEKTVEKKTEEQKPNHEVVALQNQLAQLRSEYTNIDDALRDSNAKIAAAEEAAEDAAIAKADKDSDLRNSGKDLDLEELSRKELLDVIAGAFDKGFDAKSSKLVKQVSVEMDTIKDQMKQFGQAMVQQTAERSVVNARSKYKDFDDMRDDTVKVLNDYPQLNIEDAYLLAKSKRIKDVPSEKESFSERPSRILTNNENEERSPAKRKEETPRGSRGGLGDFRSIMQAGVDKVIDSRKGVYFD